MSFAFCSSLKMSNYCMQSLKTYFGIYRFKNQQEDDRKIPTFAFWKLEYKKPICFCAPTGLIKIPLHCSMSCPGHLFAPSLKFLRITTALSQRWWQTDGCTQEELLWVMWSAVGCSYTWSPLKELLAGVIFVEDNLNEAETVFFFLCCRYSRYQICLCLHLVCE